MPDETGSDGWSQGNSRSSRNLLADLLGRKESVFMPANLSPLSSVAFSLLSASPLAVWVHTPHPFLIRFSEEAGIRYYGLAYLLGFVFGAWMFRLYYKAGRTPLNPAASM